jgi:hypothetical protein
MIYMLIACCVYYIMLFVYMRNRATCHWRPKSWRIDYWDERTKSYKGRRVNILDILCLVSINIPFVMLMFAIFYSCHTVDSWLAPKGNRNETLGN